MITFNYPSTLATLSIQDVLSNLHIDPNAIIIIQQIEFYLPTNEQRHQFVNLARRKLVELQYPLSWMGRVVAKLFMDIRKERIKHQRISLRQFLNDYEINPIFALENLYQEPVGNGKMEMIETNHMTPEELYIAHRLNPEYRLMEIIICS